MKSFSIDLRQRIIDAIDAKQGTHQQVADRFSVSVPSLRKLLHQRRTTGSIDPKPRGGGRTPIRRPGHRTPQERRRRTPRRYPGLTGPDPRRQVQPVGHLPRAGGPRHRAKEKSNRAAEQDDPELMARRIAQLEKALAVDPGHLVSLDETGTNTTMGRTHGRAASGVRVDGPVPHGHHQTTTLTAAVRLDGVIESASLAFDGATDAAMFQAYVRTNLVPGLRPGDVVILDDPASHKGPEVERLIREAGASVCFLPPYSPDFNPIEAMFGKLRAFLREAKARTKEA